jgi:plasmid replication initiation protein
MISDTFSHVRITGNLSELSDSIDLIDDQKDQRVVRMRNELIRRSQKMSLPVKRLLALAIAMCDSKQKILLHQAQLPGTEGAELRGWEVRITVAQYLEQYPHIGEKSAYNELKDAASALMKCTVTWIEEGRGRGKPTLKEIPFTTENEYSQGQGYVTVRFHGKIAPFLLGLEREFTRYKLSSAAHFRSMYSWRLMELLAQFQKTGLVRIDYDEFCDALDAPDSCRKDFGQLRRRVIEPAVAELQAKNGVEVEWKGIKVGGRKISGLEFTFKPSQQGNLF